MDSIWEEFQCTALYRIGTSTVLNYRGAAAGARTCTSTSTVLVYLRVGGGVHSYLEILLSYSNKLSLQQYCSTVPVLYGSSSLTHVV